MTTYIWKKYSTESYWNESPTSPNVYSDHVVSDGSNLARVYRVSISNFDTIIALSNCYGSFSVSGTKYPDNSTWGYYKGSLAITLTLPKTSPSGNCYFIGGSTYYYGSIVGNFEHKGVIYAEINVTGRINKVLVSDIYEHHVIKNYIGEVTGEDDDYPDDGLHTDDYWYTKKTIDESVTLIQPDGGETVNGEYEIQWTNTDASLASIIELSTDNGATWRTIKTTTAGAVAYTHNFLENPQTSQALIRITPSDGEYFGTSDTSAGVFTNLANVAPTQPTELSPANNEAIDRTLIQRLSWQHNDYDAQSKFDLQWSDDGGSTWTTVTETTSRQYKDFAASTFTNGIITWKVRTYDQFAEVSPYSEQAVFIAGEPSDAPIITSSSAVTVARPVITWTQTDQTEYEVEIYDSTMTIVWDSGEVVSTNKSVTAGADLTNGATYTLKIRTKNSDDLWSEFAIQTLTVSYTPPEMPTLTITTDSSDGSITLVITNPPGTTAVLYNEIYRDGERIATNLGGVYVDQTPEPDRVYQYQAKAIGDNGTARLGEIYEKSVSLDWALLSLATDYTKYIELKYELSVSVNKWTEQETMFYAGRGYPVSEFGEFRNEGINVAVTYITKNDYLLFMEMYNSKEPLLLRDKKIGKAFVSLSQLMVNPERKHDIYRVSFLATKIDYSEVV